MDVDHFADDHAGNPEVDQDHAAWLYQPICKKKVKRHYFKIIKIMMVGCIQVF